MKNSSVNNFDKILSDNISGSSELVLKLNNYVKQNADDKDELVKIIETAKQNFSSFEIIQSYIKSLQRIVNEKDSKAIIDFTISFENMQVNKYIRLYENAKSYLKRYNYVLTLSNSKTITDVFKLWKNDNPKLRVVVSESRPKNEGRILAKKLIKNDIKVDFITEALLENFVPKIDAVIISADKVLKNGNIVNKIGSKLTAILCKHYKRPFIILGTKDKFSSNSYFNPKNENPDEVWKFSNQSLKIYNRYFEVVEGNLITKIFTD